MNAEQVESMALVIHKLGERLACVVHSIQADASGRLIMGAGKPLSRKVERSVAAILAGKETRRAGFIPDCALISDPGILVWYRKPQSTVLNMEGADVEVQTPALLFKLEDSELSVVALKTKSRPGPTTAIFHCGLPNINAFGQWCSGGNALPSQPTFDDIAFVERMFFTSPFTHHGGSPLECSQSPWDFWLEESRAKSFPLSALVPIKVDRAAATVADFINGDNDD